jgi:hypothetical protein
MKHAVSTKILQDILNYLANRPYGEVSALIEALQSDAKAIDEAPPAEVVVE